MRTAVAISAFILLVVPPSARAQQGTQGADSLAREVARLKARIDSLERRIANLPSGQAASQRDTAAQASSELAAILAAAKEAAGPPPDTAAQANRQFVDQSRSQPKLNPELSATGDARVLAQGKGPQANDVDVREFEVALQSPLDPFSNTKIFATFSNDEIGIEEGYAYWTGLPGHLRLDIGRFRQQFGELNRWHAHELPQSEYPLPIREYFGGDGLVGDGVSAYWLIPAGGGALGTHELTAQATLASNETVFEGSNRVAWMAHLNNFWSLSPATFVQVGGSALYGENPDSSLKSTVFGIDFRLNWRPPQQGSYKSFTLRAEGFAARREVAGVGPTRRGGYIAGQYQLSRQLFVGVEYDHVEPLSGGDAVQAVVPNLTWWQSEWVYIRGEWRYASYPQPAGPALTDHRFLIQAVWAIGPHKHENY